LNSRPGARRRRSAGPGRPDDGDQPKTSRRARRLARSSAPRWGSL
jgi:hypothetical protein